MLAGEWGQGQDVGAVEGGRGAAREGGERVGGCEEEGGAEAVVGVDLRPVGHFWAGRGVLVGFGVRRKVKGLISLPELFIC